MTKKPLRRKPNHKTVKAEDQDSKDYFGKFAKFVAKLCGSPWAFCLALSSVIIWGLTGPVFQYSETWQLVINTSTTIITFLMVFVIQNTQNKDTTALHLKIDELIRATEGAHNALMNLEELSEVELEKIKRRYCHLAADARNQLRAGKKDTNKPEATEDFDIA